MEPIEPIEMSDTTQTMAMAVDLGGTTTRVAIALSSAAPDAATALQHIATFATEPSYAAQMARLGAVIKSQAEVARPRVGQVVAGIGVSLGGRIAEDGGSVSVAPNLPDYEGRPFVRDLSALCGGLPVRLAHDAVCGLLAERRAGALRGVLRCAYLTLSTGTGCAIHLESPAEGDAGVTLSIELGHQLLDHNARVCLCGQVGCLETYTGGRQLALRFGQPIETLDDANSSEMWREFAEKLSVGLVNLAHLTRVERVAIGGAIALNHPSLLETLRVAVAERLRNARLELVAAALGEAAPLIGAATLLTTPEGELLH